MSLFKNILVDKYKFILKNNHDGLLEYHHDLGNGNYAEIQNFEKKIDEFDKQLPKLTRFILPGGTELAGWFHVLRTTCRRSERETVEFFLSNTSHTIDEDSQRIMLKYLNRLSDLFFMYARKYSEGKEILT